MYATPLSPLTLSLPSSLSLSSQSPPELLIISVMRHRRKRQHTADTPPMCVLSRWRRRKKRQTRLGICRASKQGGRESKRLVLSLPLLLCSCCRENVDEQNDPRFLGCALIILSFFASARRNDHKSFSSVNVCLPLCLFVSLSVCLSQISLFLLCAFVCLTLPLSLSRGNLALLSLDPFSPRLNTSPLLFSLVPSPTPLMTI